MIITSYNNICDYLSDGKLEFQMLNCGPTGKLIVVPKIARILGLWTKPEESSHLWINPPLLQNSAVSGNSWANTGGHRIWIAPERQFFIRDLSDPLGSYMVPAGIDPGDWSIGNTSDGVVMSTKAEIFAFGLNRKIPIELVRKTKPLSTIPYTLPSSEITWAGYSETVTLEAKSEIKTGVWSLLQVPLGGVVSILSNGHYKVFFGEERESIKINSDFLTVHYDESSKFDFKIGLKASAVTSNILFYEIPYKNRSRLIAVTYEKYTDSVYADHPWSEPADTGYLLQFFYGGNWGFGELEVHGPSRGEVGSCRSELNISVMVFEYPLSYSDQIKQIIIEKGLT